MKRMALRAQDGTNQLRGSTKLLLSTRQERSARSSWAAGMTISEIASEIAVSVDTLKARLQDQLADLPKRGRGRGSRGGARRPRDPTPEEIYGKLALIEQESWSDEERAVRWQGWPQVQEVGENAVE